MLNRFLLISFLFFTVFVAGGASVRARECDVAYETITTLFYPELGSYNVWDAVFGEGRHIEVFRSVVPMAEGGALAAGEMQAHVDLEARLMLVRFDGRGRKVWERYHSIEGLLHVVKILSVGKQYVVLANRSDQSGRALAWLGFFGEDGGLLLQADLEEKSKNLEVLDFAGAADGAAYVASARVSRLDAMQDGALMMPAETYIYILSEKGQLLQRRGYLPGSESEIQGVSGVPVLNEGEDAGFAVSGYFVNSAKKKIGWAARLAADGSLVWQEQYSRGLGMQIKRILSYKGKYFLAFGDVLPADGGRVGTWLGLLDAASGKVMWQRYLRGRGARHDYLARDMFVRADGLISVMMMADYVPDPVMNDVAGSADDKEETAFEKELLPENISYVHVLSLSPRGVILGGDAYFNGKKIEAYQMVEGTYGERLIAGYTDVPYNEILDQPYVEDAELDLDLGDATIDALSLSLPGAGSGDGMDVDEKSLTGLEKLNKRLAEEKMADPEERAELPALDGEEALTRNGWLVAGDGPDPYEDLCVVQPVELR